MNWSILSFVNRNGFPNTLTFFSVSGPLIDELDLLEIQSESTLPVFAFDQPSEVWEMLAVDATTQR